ncbi:EndoU domain-containing protein [Frischella sp. Ac13]|uniref:EndoU domain-containing protein n=3 Tax=Frischella TaxID=1335631 RepID=A0ABR7R119_9GAMM|nr:EndoU domain-containing protein [Frischella japonica]
MFKASKFIRPLQKMGSWGKGMIAGSVTDFVVFNPHEERLSNLIQQFPELANPVTEYLQAKPDDKAAEGRLKNSLEGLLIGSLAEPLTRSLRLLKYARIKITATEVRTKVHYKIDTVTVELDEVNWNNVVEKGTRNIESKVGEYLEDFTSSSTPAELIQQQADKGTQITINTEHILNGEIKTYANGTRIGTGGHYLRDPNIRVDIWTGAADANGVTKGYISVRDPATGKWYKKQAETTFFPEHWSKRQTEMEIKSAFGNSKPKPGESEKWIGTSSSGIKMEGYYKKPNGTGATAWPVYQGKTK